MRNDDIEKLKKSVIRIMLFNLKAFKRNKFFFTDECGRFISATHFKRFFIITFFFSMIAIPIVLSCIFLLSKSAEKILSARKQLLQAEQKIEKLTYQIYILEAETFLESKEGEKIEQLTNKKIKKAQDTNFKLKIADFKITEENKSNIFQVNFSIRNRNKSDDFMGRLFIILKSLDEKKAKTISFPATVTQEEKENGQYFSIDKTEEKKFTFKIKTNNSRLSNFKMCSVNIYTMDKKLVKKMNFKNLL